MAKKRNLLSKKKKSVKLPVGKLYVNATFNNTILTITDEKWNKVSGGWTGKAGFKGTKESTPFAAEVLAKQLLSEARDEFWLKEVGLILRWLWLWREWVFKAINDIWGIDIMYIRENTPLQFGWCKRPRPRRN